VLLPFTLLTFPIIHTFILSSFFHSHKYKIKIRTRRNHKNWDRMWGRAPKEEEKFNHLNWRRKEKKLQNKKSKTEKVFHFLKSSQWEWRSMQESLNVTITSILLKRNEKSFQWCLSISKSVLCYERLSETIKVMDQICYGTIKSASCHVSIKSASWRCSVTLISNFEYHFLSFCDKDTTCLDKTLYYGFFCSVYPRINPWITSR